MDLLVCLLAKLKWSAKSGSSKMVWMHTLLLFIHSNSTKFDTQNPASISIILAAFNWPQMDLSAIVAESFVVVALQFFHL